MFRGTTSKVSDQNADSVEDVHVRGVDMRRRYLCADDQFF